MGAGTGEGSVGTGAGQGEAGLRHPRVGGKLWGFLEKLQNALLFPSRRVAGLKVCSQVFLPWTHSHGLGRVQHSHEAEPAPQVLPGWHCCSPCLAVPRPRAFLWVSIEDFQTSSACICTPPADGWQWFVSWLGCAAPLLLQTWGLYMWYSWLGEFSQCCVGHSDPREFPMHPCPSPSGICLDIRKRVFTQRMIGY